MKKTITLIFSTFALLIVNAQEFPKINANDVEIVRDEWGVPHIFGNTDAEAAYGLAWANAEDAFKEMQDLLIVGKKMKGKQEGIDGAKADFFANVIRATEIVERDYNTLPQDFLKYIDGYVQGINRYAELHKDEVIVKGSFPITTKDILATYVTVMSFLTDASGALDKIYNGKLDEIPTTGKGSNAFAVNSTRTIDGNTYLCINPHMQMLGTFSFYEAHIVSNEGLNMHGALFFGGTSIYMGNNEHLGWGMTWNYFDQGDIYKLEMHPKKKNTYLYNGEWKKLETNKFWLKVRVGKKLVLPVKKKSYWSELGAVIKSTKSKDYYAFKYPAFYDITAPLQWYRMDKATNFKEFKEALNIFGVSMFNIVYADRDDNIYYVSYGQIPYRNDSLTKLPYINANSSDVVWQRLHTLDELPHNENPKDGYVFNTNNTPFQSDSKLNIAYKNASPSYVDGRPSNNNRALRIIEQMDEKDKISFEDFQAIKFDNKYSKNTYLIKQMAYMFEMNPNDFPEISDAITLIQAWDFEADSLDESAAMLLVAIDKIFTKKHYGDKQFVTGIEINNQEIIDGIKEAKAWFLDYYGTIHVPLGKIFKAQKGDLMVTSPGYPDALAANYGKPQDSLYIALYGDTYTQFVNFSKDGVQEIRTLVPFGESYHEEDESYFNQADLFRKQETKEMSLDRDEIYKNAKKIYHPE